MFNKIQNPKTGRWVSIHGTIGKRVLNNYMRGGAGAGAGDGFDGFGLTAEDWAKTLLINNLQGVGARLVDLGQPAFTWVEIEESVNWLGEGVVNEDASVRAFNYILNKRKTAAEEAAAAAGLAHPLNSSRTTPPAAAVVCRDLFSHQ